MLWHTLEEYRACNSLTPSYFHLAFSQNVNVIYTYIHLMLRKVVLIAKLQWMKFIHSCIFTVYHHVFLEFCISVPLHYCHCSLKYMHLCTIALVYPLPFCLACWVRYTYWKKYRMVLLGLNVEDILNKGCGLSFPGQFPLAIIRNYWMVHTRYVQYFFLVLYILRVMNWIIPLNPEKWSIKPPPCSVIELWMSGCER